jgi:hypothetical protein
MRTACNAIASILVCIVIVLSIGCGGIGATPMGTSINPNATKPWNTAPGEHAPTGLQTKPAPSNPK